MEGIHVTDMILSKSQQNVYERSLTENIIAFLPESSDRLTVTLSLIKYHVESNGAERLKRGKRKVVAFIAPTKSLVKEYKTFIRANSELLVRSYRGDMVKSISCDGTDHNVNIMSWRSEMWQQEMDEVDVMLMTSKILRHIFECQHLAPDDFSSFIFTECQHAVGKDSMAHICHFISKAHANPKLSIFGMISAPLSCVKGSLVEKIRDLETTMHARLVVFPECLKETCDKKEDGELTEYTVLRYRSNICCDCASSHVSIERGVELARDCCCSCHCSKPASAPKLFSGAWNIYLQKDRIKTSSFIKLEDFPMCIIYHAHLRILHLKNLLDVQLIVDELAFTNSEMCDILGEKIVKQLNHLKNCSADVREYSWLLMGMMTICEDVGLYGALYTLQDILSITSDWQILDVGDINFLSDMCPSRNHSPKTEGLRSNSCENMIPVHDLNLSRLANLKRELENSFFPIESWSTDATAFLVNSLFDMFAGMLSLLGSERCRIVAESKACFCHCSCKEKADQKEQNEKFFSEKFWCGKMIELIQHLSATNNSRQGMAASETRDCVGVGSTFGVLGNYSEPIPLDINGLLVVIACASRILVHDVASKDISDLVGNEFNRVNMKITSVLGKHGRNGDQLDLLNSLPPASEPSTRGYIAHNDVELSSDPATDGKRMESFAVTSNDFLLTSKCSTCVKFLLDQCCVREKANASSIFSSDSRENEFEKRVWAAHCGCAVVFTNQLLIARSLLSLFQALLTSYGFVQGVSACLLPTGQQECMTECFERDQFRVYFATDMSCCPSEEMQVHQVVNYDPPITVDNFMWRRGLISSSNACVSMLFSDNAAGDFDLKSFSSLLHEEYFAKQHSKKNKQKLFLFVNAVTNMALLQEADKETRLVHEVESEDYDRNAHTVFASEVLKENYCPDVACRKSDSDKAIIFDEDKADIVNTIAVKLVPDCLLPPVDSYDSEEKESLACKNSLPCAVQSTYQPVCVYLYGFCGAVDHPNVCCASFVYSCANCSSYLEAMNSCGMGFLQPIPHDLLCKPMNFVLRGSDIVVTLQYLGSKILAEKEMLLMQMFHRSILCWETDGPIVPNQPTSTVAFEKPLLPSEWAKSSNNAWYIMFPLCHRESQKDFFHFNRLFSKTKLVADRMKKEIRLIHSHEWLQHLQSCASEASSLVHGLFFHQYRSDKILHDKSQNKTESQDISSAEKYPLQYSHKREDLIGKLFYRDKDSIYVGIEDVGENGETGPTITFDDIMLEGKSADNEDSSAVNMNHVSYLDYFISKNRLSRKDAATLRHDGGHALIRAAGVPVTLSLIQILSNTQSEEFTRVTHDHTSVMHFIPAQCTIIGRSCWFFSGLVFPSIAWRVGSLLIAVEAQKYLSINMPLSHVHLLSANDMLKSVLCPRDSCKIKSGCDINSICDTLLPDAGTILTALTPRRALEMQDSERLELLGDAVLKYVMSWVLYVLNPQASEGQLTSLRMDFISNAFLTRQAKNHDLVKYLRSLTFSTGKQELRHHPPGMRYHPNALKDASHVQQPPFSEKEQYLRTLWNKNINKGVKQSVWEKRVRMQVDLDSQLNGEPCDTVKQHENVLNVTMGDSTKKKRKKKSKEGQMWPSQHISSQVKAKVISDMVEALLGAYYLAGGVSLAVAFMLRLQIWPVDSRSSRDSKCDACGNRTCDDACVTRMSTTRSPSTDAISSSVVAEIGCIFNYTFRDHSLLEMAITHSSHCGEGTYQRLEFLGDGILDLAVVDLLYHALPAASPGQLTDLKCSLVNNKVLGCLAASLNLHKYVRTTSQSLRENFEFMESRKHDNVLLDSDCVEHNTSRAGYFKSVKVLADIMEAIIGGIFLDSDCNFRSIQNVICSAGIFPPEIQA